MKKDNEVENEIDEQVSPGESEEVAILRRQVNEARAALGAYASVPDYHSSQPSPRDVTPGKVWDPVLRRFVSI